VRIMVVSGDGVGNVRVLRVEVRRTRWNEW